jgi:trimeric autotransporter adhesin
MPLALAVFASSGRAQCPGQWLPGEGIPGTQGVAYAATSWDIDGPGPRSPVLVLGGNILRAGRVAAQNFAVWDGEEWSSLPPLIGNISVLASSPSGDLFAAGSFQVDPRTGSRVVRWNGVSWVAVPGLTGGDVLSLSCSADGTLYAGGAFTHADGAPCHGVARLQGDQWVPVGNGLQSQVRALRALADGGLVAVGDFTRDSGADADIVARWDGHWWSSLGDGIARNSQTTVNSVAELPDNTIVVSGSYVGFAGSTAYNHIMRWNGAAWEPLGGPITSVLRIHARPNGELVAVCSIPSVGAYGLARWTEGQWAPLGTGLDGWTSTLTEVQHGPASSTLYATGNMLRAGEVGVSYVAGWNNDTWFPLGRGINTSVDHVVRTPAGEVFIGGAFRSVAGSQVKFLATHDEHGWQQVPFATGPVSALKVLPSGDIAVAYRDREYGGPYRIARRRDQVWTQLGLANAAVYDFAELPSGELAAGGGFTAIDGVVLWQVAILSTSGWVGAGGTFLAPSSTSVRALATLANGDLVAGGRFTTVNGTVVNNIARWDGTAWHPLGVGVGTSLSNHPPILTMLVRQNGDLLVGGALDTAGGSSGRGLARWNGTAWTPMIGPSYCTSIVESVSYGTLVTGGSGIDVIVNNGTTRLVSMDASTRSLTTAQDGTIYAAGYFHTVAGVNSAHFARLIVPSADFDGDGVSGSDADIEAFFSCFAGRCCARCGSADFNADGDAGTDADIEAFFRVLAGGTC